MPSTVSIFNTGGVVPAGVEETNRADDSSNSGGGNSSSNSSSSSSSSSSSTVLEGEGEALVVLVLGPPEVDSGTGNTVFSLSAEVEVRGGGGGRFEGPGGGGCAGPGERGGPGHTRPGCVWLAASFSQSIKLCACCVSVDVSPPPGRPRRKLKFIEAL